jgi:prepilin-type N-terminal cleavage/methylation domain-containing protein
MRFQAKATKPGATVRRGGFTLIEVLVAMAFMAIIIPVVVQGLHVANRAGVVAQRKAIATRIGERVLNEAAVTGQVNATARNGSEKAGPYTFNWTLKSEPWAPLGTIQNSYSANGVNGSAVNQTTVRQLSVDVVFAVQNQNYTVHLSTLANNTSS